MATILKPGDRVKITRTFSSGRTETVEGRVSASEDHGPYEYFSYKPVKPGTSVWDYSHGAWGTCRRYKQESTRPKHAAIVEVIGTCGDVR